MSYTHLTKTEYVFIEKYFSIGMKGRQIAEKLKRGHESIYRVIRKLKEGKTAIEIYQEYKENKKKCGRKPIQLPQDEIEYVNKKVDEGWTPDVIVGRKDRPLSCGMKTLYRMFENMRMITVFILSVVALTLSACQQNELFTDINVISIEIREWDNDELINTITDEDFIATLIADLESAKSSTIANLDIPNPDYRLLFFADDKIVQEFGYYTEVKLYNRRQGQFTSFKENRHYEISTELPMNNHH